MSEVADLSRRNFLLGATVVTGAVGVGFAAAPFLISWRPSERARALGAPVEVDISKLEPGEMMKVQWQGRGVFVVNRTPALLESLTEVEGELRDAESAEPQQPDYARNAHRSIKPEILVVLGVCTHLGCAPEKRFDVGAADLGADWKGGFFCPCHGSKFDVAGRVYAGVPAPLNLVVPPHQYLSDSLILIGSDAGAA